MSKGRRVLDMTIPGRIRSFRMALRKAGYPAIDKVDATFLRYRVESYETIEEGVADMMEYVRQCRAAAADVHNYILAQLNDRVIPWWEIEDMLGAMNDDVSCYYTNDMRKELTEHPRYFGGSAEEWTDNL